MQGSPPGAARGSAPSWRACWHASSACRRLGRRRAAPRDPLGRRLELPALPRLQDGVRILGATEAAVVATERAEQVAALDVEIVAQDRAAVAQVGAHVEELRRVAVAD